MQQTVLDRLSYVIENPVLTLVIALIAGFLATRIVAAERRPGVIGFSTVGLMGFVLSHFILFYAGWNEALDSLLGLRVIVDLVAAVIGSFVIAGTVHFIKPS